MAELRPGLDAFRKAARPGVVIPVWTEFPFDLDTPVTAFAKMRTGAGGECADPSPGSGSGFAFLLESVEGGERWARYSMLGSAPREVWRLAGKDVQTWTQDGGWGNSRPVSDPFADFSAWIGRSTPVADEELPRFWGGAVGYFGYDCVRQVEHLPSVPPDDIGLPDACFMMTDCALIIDNLFSKAIAVTAVEVDEEAARNPDPAYEEAARRLAAWTARLKQVHDLRSGRADAPDGADREGGAARFTGNRSREDFEGAVRRVRDYIAAGDVYQVVVSQRQGGPVRQSVLSLYRTLRRRNPSPYLFLIEFDGMALIGSSPETLVRVADGEVTVRPIAGTRPRGRDQREDAANEADLLADQKERSEHLMLVDLGRNDVGRVAAPGTVSVPRFMEIERYSHVMHIVSEVTGQLRPGRTAVEALRACFPAGTLTGAPKVRAMEIIDELEPTKRGPYGGAAGYVGYGGGTLDVAIVIRTLLVTGGTAYAQAGAGIVYDSRPRTEWEETRHKAGALMDALDSPG